MSYAYNDPLHHVIGNALNDGCKNWGVVSGLAVSERAAGANMSVDVALGVCFVDGVEYTESGITNVVITAADGTNPRKDLIVYDTSGGTPAVVTGTPAATAIPPDITSGDILLAVVDVPALDTTITNDQIHDGRVFVINIADKAEVMLLDGTQAMAGDIDMGGHDLLNCQEIHSSTKNTFLYLHGSNTYGAAVIAYGEDNITYPGDIRFFVPNAAKDNWQIGMVIDGVSDAPIVTVTYGLDMNAQDIDDIGALTLNNATELTIASGIVTATQSYHTIDTEADAASDDLDSITGDMCAGSILILRAANSARTVVIKDSTGNLRLEGDMSLDNVQDTIVLLSTGSDWLELSRSNNGA